MVAPRGVGIGSMRPGNRSLVNVTPGPMNTWSPTHVREGMYTWDITRTPVPKRTMPSIVDWFMSVQ